MGNTESYPSQPTHTNAYASRTLYYSDVRPSASYGDNAKRAVTHMQEALNTFNRWGQLLDTEYRSIRNLAQIQFIDYEIQQLKGRGTTALRATQDLAEAYREFASLQAQRLQNASGNGFLYADQRMMDAGRSIGYRCSELGRTVSVIHEHLDSLVRQVDSLNTAQPQVKKAGLWQKVKGFFGGLLRAVFRACGSVGTLFGGRGFDPQIGGRTEEERLNNLIWMLKNTIATEAQQVKADLNQHNACLNEIMNMVDTAQATSRIESSHAEAARREWAAQVQMLVGNRSY